MENGQFCSTIQNSCNDSTDICTDSACNNVLFQMYPTANRIIQQPIGLSIEVQEFRVKEIPPIPHPTPSNPREFV